MMEKRIAWDTPSAKPIFLHQRQKLQSQHGYNAFHALIKKDERYGALSGI